MISVSVVNQVKVLFLLLPVMPNISLRKAGSRSSKALGTPDFHIQEGNHSGNLDNFGSGHSSSARRIQQYPKH